MIDGSMHMRPGVTTQLRANPGRIKSSYFRMSTVASDGMNQSGRLISYKLSDSSVARDGNVIKTAGWDLSDYRKNPIVLWSHDPSQPPVARCVDIGIVGDELRGTADFPATDLYEFGDTVFRLIKGGFLNAASVSWQPLEWRWSTDKSRPGAIDFLRSELLEWSIVPVPAAPDALVTARRHGIDTRPLRQWAEQVLDATGEGPISRPTAERIRKDAAEPRIRAGKAISAANAEKISTAQDHARACIAALDELVADAGGEEASEPGADDGDEMERQRAQAKARLFRLRRHADDVAAPTTSAQTREEARKRVAELRRKYPT